MRAEQHQLVFTLWKSCICFQVLGNVSARPLVVGVTLLSSEALGAAPGLRACDAQLLISNLWHHRGPRRSPFCFRVQDLWKVTPPLSGARLGLLLCDWQAQGPAHSGMASANGSGATFLAAHVKCCCFR